MNVSIIRGPQATVTHTLPSSPWAERSVKPEVASPECYLLIYSNSYINLPYIYVISSIFKYIKSLTEQFREYWKSEI